MMDDLVSHLDSLDNPLEEAHWKQVESLSPRAAGTNNSRDGRWINVGKATSLNNSSAKKKVSRLNPDEELVLGLTLPSESESQNKNSSTQNDTDSTMASPLMKRRKFRPTESVDSQAPPPLPQSQPPSLNSTFNADNFEATGYPELEQDLPDEIMYETDYQVISAPLHTPHSVMSVPDSGHGTISTLRSQALQDRIAEISQALQVGEGVGIICNMYQEFYFEALLMSVFIVGMGRVWPPWQDG